MKKTSSRHKKKRSFQRINYRERVIIENRYCIDRKRISAIARELGRPPSAISREIGAKPRMGRGKYSADGAQRNTEIKRENQGRKSKFEYTPLKRYAAKKLKLGWSPEQISIRLPIEYVRNKSMRVSHEAIYEYIYAQVYRSGNGRVKPGCEDLRKYLARRHTRRQKKGFRKARKLERDTALPSIELRPQEVEQRKAMGHWEGDTLVSKQSDVRVKSVNERVSGIALFKKTSNGTSTICNRATIEKLKIIPSGYVKTLTQDRGSENMGFEILEQKLGIQCFFAHPYCAYERGSNENINGLFRRYFPKKTDFAIITDEQVAKVEYLLNSRPRKRLGGFTPYEVFYQKTGVALDS